MNQSEAPTQDQGRRKVLIAEDNPDSRDALRTLLEAYGFEVVEAADGAQAVRCGIESHPDIVLMDIMMPGVDGLEATRQLRHSPAFRQVPIVALTAMAGSRQKAIEAGCDDHLVKPIDIPRFLATLRRWLDSDHN